MLDLKGAWPDAALAHLLQATREHGLRDSVMIISFSLDVLERVRRLDPRIQLGFLSNQVPDPAPVLRLGNTAMLLHDAAILARGQPVVAYSSDLRERGSLLGAWTLYSGTSVQPLRELGVHWFISNVPLDPATLIPVQP